MNIRTRVKNNYSYRAKTNFFCLRKKIFRFLLNLSNFHASKSQKQDNKQDNKKQDNNKKIRKEKIMKKIVFTVVAAMMMAVSFAETTNTSAVKNVEEAGLTFDLRRLAVTLDLTDNQMDAVKVISDNFNDELISASTARRFQRHALIQQAIRKDAKQMRNVLNDKQFNTYMQLLGATLQNRFIW